MQITLNFEAAPHFCSVDLVEALTSRFCARVVKLRLRVPAGPAIFDPAPRAWVAYIDTALPCFGAWSQAAALADVLGQDGIVIRAGGATTAVGPRAERLLPLDPAQFLEY